MKRQHSRMRPMTRRGWDLGGIRARFSRDACWRIIDDIKANG